ncbi:MULTISPECIES: DNA repair protein [unclassified Roseivivax]|uniref:DNA repair protein n=1 Tax=unclassified Roseivivax TaxID=2639302 RepID=UPI001C12A8EB|nr:MULTISPECIES: DNA repair protein [unclassified Roseivivax]
MALLIAAGLAALLATLAAALGHLPWLDLSLSFGGTVYPQAGMAVQIAGTALIVGLLAYLPGNARVLALENSHRKFHITMEDVTRAYRIAHAADRTGVFNLKSEFDSVRERIAYLRDHPDLAELEAPVIEVAAQMSHLSRDLARVYSDDAVRRATDFLTQRQTEVDDFNRRLDEAKSHAVGLRAWIEDVEMDEAVAEAQLARICEELHELLPELSETLREDAQPVVEATARDAAPARDAARDWIDDVACDDDFAADPVKSDSDIVELLSRRAAQ